MAGSEPLPYEVRVAFEGRSVSVAACTCPCQWGGWCKRIVAALLAYRDAPGEVERRPSVDELLAGLSAEQLGGGVAGLVADNPAQLEPVERHVAWQRAPALGGADGDEQGPPKSSAPVDARAIRREVRGILRSLDHMRPSEAYWHGGSVVADVSHLLEQARAHLRNEDGRAALAVLR